MRNRRYRAVFAAVLALIGVGILVPVVPSGLSVRNISVNYDPGGEGAQGVLYWVPMSAPLRTLAAYGSSEFACSPRLTKWLNTYGTQAMFPQSVLITDNTTATEHVVLRVGDNQGPTKPEPGFYVQCGVPDYLYQYSTTNKDYLSWTTLRVDYQLQMVTRFRQNGAPPVYTMTLRPGQARGLVFVPQGSERYTGSLLAEVLQPDASLIALPLRINGALSTMISWPGVPPSRAVLVHGMKDSAGHDSELYCIPPSTVRSTNGEVSSPGRACSVSELRKLVSENSSNPLESIPSGWPLLQSVLDTTQPTNR